MALVTLLHREKDIQLLWGWEQKQRGKPMGRVPKIVDSLWWTQGKEDRSTVSNGIKWITTMKEICRLTEKMQCFQVFNKFICWIHECQLISLIAIDYQPVSQSDCLHVSIDYFEHTRYFEEVAWQIQLLVVEAAETTAIKGVVQAKRLKLKSSQ